MRKLIVVRRVVAEVRATEYERAWRMLREAADPVKIHAWRYRSSGDPRRFIEFLEHPGDSDPQAISAIAEASSRLEQIATGEVEEYLDATESDVQER